MHVAHPLPLSSRRYQPLRELHRNLTARAEGQPLPQPARPTAPAEAGRRPGGRRDGMCQRRSAAVRDGLA